MSGWKAISGFANTLAAGLMDKENRRQDDEQWSKRFAEQETALAVRAEADARRAERLQEIRNEGDTVQSWLQDRDARKARESQSALEGMKEQGRMTREQLKQDRADARAKMRANAPRQAPASRSDLWRNKKTGETRYFGPNDPPPGVEWQPYNNPGGAARKVDKFDPDSFINEVEGL